MITQWDLIQVFELQILLFPAASCCFPRREILLYETVFDRSLRHMVKAEVEGQDKGICVDLEQSYQGRLHAAQWT